MSNLPCIFEVMEDCTNRVLNYQLSKSIITSHAVFNYLTVLQNHITLDQKRDAINGLASYARFSKQVLELADQESALLSQEKEVLESYLSMEQQRFGSALDFVIIQEQDLQGVFPTMLLIPVTELVITLSQKPITIEIRIGLQGIQWNTNRQTPSFFNSELNPEQSHRRRLLTQKFHALLLHFTQEYTPEGTLFTLNYTT